MSSYFKSRGQSIISTDFLCIATRLEKEVALHEPRLFECSNQTGRFLMTEVADFTQDDLDEDDVMLSRHLGGGGLREVMLSASFAWVCREMAVSFWVMQNMQREISVKQQFCWLFYILSYSNPGVFKLVTRKINYKEKDKQCGRGLLQRGHQNWGFVSLKVRKLLLLYVYLLNPSSSSSLRFSFGLATQPTSTRLRSPIAVQWTILKTHPAGRDPGYPSPLLNKAMSRPPSLAGLMLGMLISGAWVQQGAVMHNKFTNKLTESWEVQST